MRKNPFNLYTIDEVIDDFTIAENALKQQSYIFLTKDNRSEYVLMTMAEYERYQRIVNENEEQSREKELPALLNGIGKRFFVDYYIPLKLNTPQNEFLSEDKHGTQASLASRVSRGRTIFKNGWEIDALRYIIDSSRTDINTMKRAQCLMNKELETFDGIVDMIDEVGNYNERSADEDETMGLEQLDNKSFAFSCIKLLVDNGRLDDRTLNILTDKEECKSKFSCSGFPILSEVAYIGEPTESACYQGGRQRFYKEKILIGNRAFVLSNHWYGPGKSMPDNRTPFQRWVLQRTK